MTPYAMTAEQAQLQEVAREFSKRVVIPRAAALDRNADPADCMSWEIVEAASEIGLRTLTLDPKYGGAGADTLTAAIVIEELCKGDLGVGVIMAQIYKLVQVMQAACTEAQKDRWLTMFSEDPRCILAVAATEPDTSSNYVIPYEDPRAGFRTTAVKVEGGWLLNGFKHFISNGNTSRLCLMLAQTTKNVPLSEGSTFFILERGTEGFSSGKVHDKMGERLVNNAELILQDCFVPESDVMGAVDQGFQLLREFFRASNIYAAASVLGVAEAAYDRALEWTQQRVQGGKPLIEHDTVAVQVAEMRMSLDVARAYVRQAAFAVDHPEAWDHGMAVYPKVFAAQTAWKVTTRALELHGGYGFMREVGMEKLVRDAATFFHSDGANLTLLLKAVRSIRATL